ncbi:MAG: biotin--[acetyl-CoA-carboxylase] ligase [Prevotellaceae bacterium]|nr:biotin--[acetyl-CoA-carboxylase] ligase [Prevotellaceae bacterium]
MITWFSEIDSTNNEACRNLTTAREGSVWAARYQTAGRGQQNNTWESDAGKNFMFSLLLRPTWLPAEDQFYISKITSLGVYDFLTQHAITSTIKWPNDAYVNDKKIAGILIEHHLGGSMLNASIIGIGLNANQQEFSKTAGQPTSMLLESGCTVAVETALPELVAAILRRYALLQQGGAQRIDEEYHARLYRLNEWRQFETGKRRFRAKIVAVQRNGQLLLQDATGDTKAFAFKEVRFAP